MLNKRRYPKLSIRSKNELAKHISSKDLSAKDALALINDVLKNRDRYWKDNKRSEPEKGKFVRSAIGTPLGKLLGLLNENVLAPHDKLLPPYIFGGVQGLNHIKAARRLLGVQRKRTLLALDITTFFEQIHRERVEYFLINKCGCSKRGARLISEICTVPKGAKGSVSSEKTIGRGFATSSRLAVWCNLDTFIALNRFIEKRLKHADPCMAIYVDDIGITASRVPIADINKLADEIDNFLYSHDKHQPLPSKREKRKISTYKEGMYILGSKLERNSLVLGPKTRKKMDKMRALMKNSTMRPEERAVARRKYRSLSRYKAQVVTPKPSKVL